MQLSAHVRILFASVARTVMADGGGGWRVSVAELIEQANQLNAAHTAGLLTRAQLDSEMGMLRDSMQAALAARPGIAPDPLRRLLSADGLGASGAAPRVVPHVVPRQAQRPENEEVTGLTIAQRIITQLLREGAAAENFSITIDWVRHLCEAVLAQLYNEGNRALLQLRPPLKVFGDIHGQLYDLQRAFVAFGSPTYGPNGDLAMTDYLFLGDYVDRGPHDVAVISLLLALKLVYPRHVYLLRGNHEDEDTNTMYGFQKNCVTMAGNDEQQGDAMHKAFNEVFEMLPLAALVEAAPPQDALPSCGVEPSTPGGVRGRGGIVEVPQPPIPPRFFCVHGGAATLGFMDTQDTIESIASIRLPVCKSFENSRDKNLLEDALWSDPHLNADARLNGSNNAYYDSTKARGDGDAGARGAGWQFGEENLKRFCTSNKLSGIIRGHEEVQEGVFFFWDHGVTVHSAPNCRDRGNLGGILQISADGSLHVRVLEAVPDKHALTQRMIDRKLLLGCLLGQALGDATGFLVEGCSEELCRMYTTKIVRTRAVIDYGVLKESRTNVLPYGKVEDGQIEWRFGQFTDDTQLARELLVSIAECDGELNAGDYASRIAGLFHKAGMTGAICCGCNFSGRIVGFGHATHRAAMKVCRGLSDAWYTSGQDTPGNGGAMRVGPLGILFLHSSDKELAIACALQSHPTHVRRTTMAAAAAVAAAVREAALSALRGHNIEAGAFCAACARVAGVLNDDVANAVRSISEQLGRNDDTGAKGAIIELGRKLGDGNGWGPDMISPTAVQSSLWSMYCFLRHPDDPIDCICAAINAGGDTDTTAAMAGAMVGARTGITKLPQELLACINDAGMWGVHDLEVLAKKLEVLILAEKIALPLQSPVHFTRDDSLHVRPGATLEAVPTPSLNKLVIARAIIVAIFALCLSFMYDAVSPGPQQDVSFL